MQKIIILTSFWALISALPVQKRNFPQPGLKPKCQPRVVTNSNSSNPMASSSVTFVINEDCTISMNSNVGVAGNHHSSSTTHGTHGFANANAVQSDLFNKANTNAHGAGAGAHAMIGPNGVGTGSQIGGTGTSGSVGNGFTSSSGWANSGMVRPAVMPSRPVLPGMPSMPGISNMPRLPHMGNLPRWG